MPKKRKKTSHTHKSATHKHKTEHRPEHEHKTEHHPEHQVIVNVPAATVAAVSKKTKKKRKSTRKKTARRTTAHHVSHKEHDIEHKLLENMVSLQKVQTDLTEKFDTLGKELSKMLALFELAARNFAKNAPLGEYEKDKEFLEKMDKLLDQNKLLAKGLTMMEDHLKERMYGQSPVSPGPDKKPAQQPANPSDPFQPSMATSNRRPLPHF